MFDTPSMQACWKYVWKQPDNSAISRLAEVLIAFSYNWQSYSGDKAIQKCNRSVGWAEFTNAQITIEWKIFVSLIVILYMFKPIIDMPTNTEIFIVTRNKG